MASIQIQTKKRSWAERHPIRSAVLYTVLTVAFIGFIATGGIAFVTQLASLLENTKENSQSKNEEIILPVPSLTTLPSNTNKKVLTVSGTTTPASTVRIFVNGTSNDYLSNSSGKFTADITLVDGTNTLMAQTVDSKGNTSKESPVSNINLDTKPPLLVIDSPKEGETYNGKKSQTITISGSVDEDSKLTVNDRVIIVTTNRSFTYNYILTEGTNTLNFKAVDSAGNETLQTINLTFSF